MADCNYITSRRFLDIKQVSTLKTKLEIEAYLKLIISEELGVAIDNIDSDLSFYELGLDSINSMFLLEKVENQFNVSLTPLYFWDYPTISAFSKLLASKI